MIFDSADVATPPERAHQLFHYEKAIYPLFLFTCNR